VKLNWYGVIGQGDGYAGSTEKILIELEKIGVDVSGIFFPRANAKVILSREGWNIKSKPFQFSDIGLCYCLPASFTTIINPIKIGFTMFETSKLPRGINTWAGVTGNCEDVINQMDCLFVPCQHNKELFEREGVTIPVEVIPLGVDPEKFYFIERDPKKAKFTFLWISSFTERKNPLMVIKTFKELFKDNPNVELVMKVGNIYHERFKNVFENQDKNIKIIKEFLTEEKLMELYKDADCFIFPSRGEGFGLTPLEAMATGLPTVLAKNTGMADFCDETYNYPLYNQALVKINDHEFINDDRWGDVGEWYQSDPSELKARMLQVYNNREKSLEKGKLASDWVLNNWTYKQTAEKLKRKLEDIYANAINNRTN